MRVLREEKKGKNPGKMVTFGHEEIRDQVSNR